MGEVRNKSTTLVALFFIITIHRYSYQVLTASCIKKEREALLKLKASFIDSSNRLVSWEGIDCCSWNGVGCNQTNGHVVKLDLRNHENNFSSALVSNGIDSSLFELKYLNYLDLSGNFFNYTQIPDYFSSMLELNYLNLSHTYFYGRIPHFLRNLTKLNVLDFNIHKYYLYVQSDLEMTQLFMDDHGWISSLSSLEYVDLSGVELKSNLDLVQVLNKLPSLLSLKLRWCGLQNTPHMYAPLNSSFVSKVQRLDLSHNMFGGPIPNFLQNMTSLRFLDLSSNQFNSSILLWLSNILRNLVVLSLGSNLFTGIEGALPSIIRNNCHMKEFDLSDNPNFQAGDVFGSHENLSAGFKDYGLENLYLANISLYGPIPASLGNLSTLKELDISYNMLSGGIPASFGQLSNLEFLKLRVNNLDGVIPESFGQLQNLDHFDFSWNPLRCVISEIHFANLSRLTSIYMEGNSYVSFKMKHDWIPPFQLTFFSVGSSKGFGLSGFPRWLATQKQIKYLDLANTSISGPMSTWLRFPSLFFLDISNNQITGPLPKSIGNQILNIRVLFISNTHINGSLPRSICRLSLPICVLSNNRLSGTIPSCLVSPYVILFDLSSNKFSGVFPTSSQNLSELQWMNLANNELEGEPLTAMGSCKSLAILKLEGNQFSGNIPSWFGTSLGSLKILNLRGNMFSGIIPSTLWLLSRLQILILADNKFEGNIPPKFANFSTNPSDQFKESGWICKPDDYPFGVCYVSYFRQVMKSRNLNYSYFQIYSMVNIDLSNNNLHGNIPSGITTVKALFALNLSHNNLSGTIPFEIGRAVSLESLDLSFNQLSGPIPNSMSTLNSLGALKLSNNNFSGRIPREGQLSTFNDASSYEGNPYLCGDPLSVKCPNENSGKPQAKIDNFDDYEEMWFYIIIMLGYALGFWGVVGALILKRSWRRAYFHFMDEIKDKIHVAILVYVTRLKQRMRGNNSFYP